MSATLAPVEGSANSVRGAAPRTVEVKNVNTRAGHTRHGKNTGNSEAGVFSRSTTPAYRMAAIFRGRCDTGGRRNTSDMMAVMHEGDPETGCG